MNLFERLWYALDVRPGDGYGQVAAAKSTVLLIAAVGLHVAVAVWHLDVPTYVVYGLDAIAGLTTAHDTGAAKAAPTAD